MRLLATLLVTGVLGLVCGSRIKSTRLSRESKWDIIHHEYHGPPAPLAEDGRVIDTPEVAKARSNHLAIYAETVAEHVKKMSEWAKKEVSKASDDTGESDKSKVEAAEVVEQRPQETPVESAPVQEVESEGSADAAPEVEETKPVVEAEGTNEVSSRKAPNFQYLVYEGPPATIGENGLVQDTPEVQKAKEAHLLAYQQARELTELNDEPKTEGATEDLELYEMRNRDFYPSAPVQLFYSTNRPVGSIAQGAPISEYGHVIDTLEVQRAKAKHRRAHEYAQYIGKQCPAEENTI
ncbi:PREDICTED: uncharacterized protein LOC105360817 [Ceratosolen solmsi marchali]|uniref:Uncharacterized protein LOC105360817 n=1 Tax=Ceratosolen solmsi marchali TaxID=326594 RepID=A0AAJ6YDM2_9HYME|nr:PREDICTED: uncharacterized protein LOC105360817 [Ceratosolen solmsi marchali]